MSRVITTSFAAEQIFPNVEFSKLLAVGTDVSVVADQDGNITVAIDIEDYEARHSAWFRVRKAEFEACTRVQVDSTMIHY